MYKVTIEREADGLIVAQATTSECINHYKKLDKQGRGPGGGVIITSQDVFDFAIAKKKGEL